MKLFDNKLNWYKGNLHCHTDLSDGAVTPDICVQMYKNHGYDFLAITDHRKFFAGYRENNFLLLNGTEFHLNYMKERKAYHIVGIGIDKEIYTDDDFTPQMIIDEINKHNGIAIIAHPAWSLLTHSDLTDLHGYAGIEIWNTTSEVKILRGNSAGYVDVAASKGAVKLIFAADDTHWYTSDIFGGYIMVSCASLDRDSIMESILKGNFYCSQGPIIKQITVDEESITVESSPVRQIAFLSDTFFSSKDRIWSRENGLVDTGSYKIKESDTVVRAECTDECGNKAWSQLIKVNVKNSGRSLHE